MFYSKLECIAWWFLTAALFSLQKSVKNIAIESNVIGCSK